MKKFVAAAVLFTMAFAFAACGGGEEETGGTASLTIKNESAYELTDVIWNGVSFDSIIPGGTATKSVRGGSGYVRFKPSLNPVGLRTSESVVLQDGEQKEFIILNNTLVVNEANNNSGTLASFSGIGQITIKQGEAAIAQHGNYDFGMVRTETAKDITFTIGNTGGKNLILEAVGGRRINLEDDPSGYFSVQQPLATTVAPGNTTTFTVRFTPPATRGASFRAVVRIKSDSYIDDEFAFEVTGTTGVAQIEVKQSGTALAQNGEYSFGTIKTGTNKDITFTIENSGTENLTIESVGGNRINLTDNTETRFSVTQSPAFAAVAPGNSTTFTIRFTAPAVRGSNFAATVQIKTDSNTGGEFAFGVTGSTGVAQIAVKEGTAVIAYNGEYNFGAVKQAFTEEIVFTLENSGTEDLTIESVNGGRINLTDNTTGYFSVSQQPISAIIPGGGSVTFALKFAPTAIGNNFTAAVQIKTDSHTHSEFAFGVIGNGTTAYLLVGTGPGGGTIFFAEGGQYKECSGELGSYNRSNAIATAQEYRGGSFTNWRLPDSGEGILMLNQLGRSIVGTNRYWTSSTTGSSSWPYWSVYFEFSSGTASATLNSASGSSTYRTRAVRSFTQ